MISYDIYVREFNNNVFCLKKVLGVTGDISGTKMKGLFFFISFFFSIFLNYFWLELCIVLYQASQKEGS